MDSRNNLSKPTSHPNELQLKLVDSYEGAQISLQEKEHFITDGQPYSGTSLSGYTIKVEAGRKGSKEVTNWFNR